MNYEKKQVANSPDRQTLKELNKAYTECITKDFLGRFLAGDKVSIDDFCVKERQEMQALDS